MMSFTSCPFCGVCGFPSRETPLVGNFFYSVAFYIVLWYYALGVSEHHSPEHLVEKYWSHRHYAPFTTTMPSLILSIVKTQNFPIWPNNGPPALLLMYAPPVFLESAKNGARYADGLITRILRWILIYKVLSAKTTNVYKARSRRVLQIITTRGSWTGT